MPAWSVVEGIWAVARLGPGDPMPAWAATEAFASVTRTAEELSIVCRESSVPDGVRAERGWALLKLAGPFPFTATGILASFLAPLARGGIPVFTVSTFDTDYVLVKRSDLGRALDALEEAREARRRRLEERLEPPND
jgi:hypothetical protein